MVLKDIKNEPDVSGGLHPPFGLLKRRMSDTGYKSSLPPKSKIRRGSLQKGLNDCLTSTKREQIAMNVCSDLTNDLQPGSLALQNKKGSKSGYCKVESKQGGLKSSDGMLLTVTPADDVHLTSPECHSASTLLDISNMSTSFFADPTADLKYEAPETTGVTSNKGNKYFSTPMVSKRVKKKLTPVMELEVESYTTNEFRSPHKIATSDKIHKHLNAGILLESPAQDLLYRSFFATECQEIVNQLEGIESIVKSPAKRKADVLDVSTIDAEPPPYDSSPMKSMLACEVANMMRSLDNSPVKEGVSFGESLLDLENIDMQLHDFDVSECSKGKSFSECGVEGIFHLGADVSGCCSMKRQKTEQLANIKSKPNSRTPVKGLLANTVDNRTKQQSNNNCSNNSGINTEQHTRCNSEEVTLGDTTQVIKTDIIGQVAFIQDEDPPKDLVNTTQNIVNETSSDELHNANTTHVIQAELKSPVTITLDTTLMHKIATTNNPQATEFWPQTSIIPHDIPSVSEEVSLANNTQVIELVSQSFANITQDICPIHDETTSQMIEVGPHPQVISAMRKVVAIDNTSLVTHMGVQPSVNSTQDILSVHEEDLASNTTQVIEEEPQTSANTTQDISSIRDMVVTTNTMQLKEAGPQTSANITQDITSICNLDNAANTSQETEVGPQSSANTTQDIVVIHSFDNAASTTHVPEVGLQSSVNTSLNVNAANITQVTDVGLQSSANTTQDITSIHSLDNASNTTQATDVVLQSSANTTQDIVVIHSFDNAASTTQLTEVVLQPSANTTQDVVVIHSFDNAASTTQLPEVVLQSSANTTQDVVVIHSFDNAVSTTQLTEVGLQPSANTTQDVVVIHSFDNAASTTQLPEVGLQSSVNTSQNFNASNKTQATEVVLQSSANTTPDIASIHNLVSAANTTQETVLSSQYSANTTQNVALHKVSIDSSIQTMEVVPHLQSNNTLITSLKDEVNTSDTTDNIKIPSEILTNKAPVIPPAEVIKTHIISADAKKMEIVATSPQAIDAVRKNIPDVTNDRTSPEVPVTNSHLVQGVPQNSSNAADHQNFEDLHLITDASEDSQKNISSKEKVSHKTSTVSLNDLNPEPTLISKETVQGSVQGQKHIADMVCDVDNGTIGQSTSKVTGVEKSKATEEKCSKNSSEKVSLQNEVYSFKESNDPLLSESCSMIHEEENAHDVSVFSAGSLSFVTSTPVPGFNNFQFQKTYRDSVQQDPNVSIGSVLEEPTNKVVVDQTVASQQKLVLNGNDKFKQIQRASMLPPSTTDRGVRPPSGLMSRQIPSSSGIPSARRSLALANNPTGQNSAKEPMFSKTVPRGIPGRGTIRPPMVRQSLPRASLGGMKQSTEGTGCNSIANKLKGSAFRTPKPAAAKLPNAPSLVKPPSRLIAPNSTRLTVGAQNVTNSLQDPACGETVTGMRPPTASDVRTGLPKPVSSSIRPPQSHSQKVSPKLKSSLPGLSIKKTLPALGPRKDIASAKGAIMSAKSSIKQNASSVANEGASFQAGVKSSSSPCRNEHTTAENLKLQTSISPLEKCPATSTDESDKCLHQETCKCCHLRYQQLLQELEELKKCHTCKGKE